LALRRTLGRKKDYIKGGSRKYLNEELHNLYSSPKIIRTFKSRTMKLAGHIACKGEMRNAYGILVGRA
jgi:hypothetical protein